MVELHVTRPEILFPLLLAGHAPLAVLAPNQILGRFSSATILTSPSILSKHILIRSVPGYIGDTSNSLKRLTSFAGEVPEQFPSRAKVFFADD